METPQIEIELSKIKIFLILIGSLGFVILGIYMGFSEEITSRRYSSSFITVIGLLSISFFSLTLVASLIKLFDFKPGLIISKEGIYENSSFISLGFINWEDVLEISKIEINDQKFVILYLKDNAKYIQKSKGFKKRVAKINYKTYGSPVSISANGLKSSFKDLYPIIERAFLEYNKSQNQ